MKWTTLRIIFHLYLHVKSFGLFGVNQSTIIYISFLQKKLFPATHRYLDFCYPIIQVIPLYLDITSPHLTIIQHLFIFQF